jgi:hypothetical protein
MLNDKKRAPPWFKCFAADDIASSSYFGLTSGERGLLDSMARAYWIEGELPATPRLLAAIVRLPETEVVANLTPGVLSHFEKIRGTLAHRELARQRQNSDDARKRMSDAGRKGAAMTNAKHADPE